MSHTILVATDGSPLSEKAVKAAIRFAKASKGSIVAFSVAEAYPYPNFSIGSFSERRDYEKCSEELAKEYVREAAAAAKADKVQCKTMVVVSSHPYEEIVKASHDYHCDTIFMPSQNRKGWDKMPAQSSQAQMMLDALSSRRKTKPASGSGTP